MMTGLQGRNNKKDSTNELQSKIICKNVIYFGLDLANKKIPVQFVQRCNYVSCHKGAKEGITYLTRSPHPPQFLDFSFPVQVK